MFLLTLYLCVIHWFLLDNIRSVCQQIRMIMVKQCMLLVMVIMKMVVMLMTIDDQTPSSGHQALNTIVAVKQISQRL